VRIGIKTILFALPPNIRTNPATRQREEEGILSVLWTEER
jgi:hypothetical protein